MEWMNNVNGLQHIGIPTLDLDRTIAFYQKLGFEVALKTKNGEQDVAFLRLKGLTLETYEEKEIAGQAGAVNHIAMDVSDIQEAFDFVKGLGVTILEEITYLPFWDNGIKYFIAEGPNAERLEFSQIL